MYSKQIPYTNFQGKPKNKTVHFNLTESEIFKLLPEFQRVFTFRRNQEGDEIRKLDANEVVEFYTDFEKIMLEAWGVPSEDGEHFRKAGRYEFAESAMFSACMVMFLTDPAETGKLLDAMIPKELANIVETADANLVKMAENPKTADALQEEIARLRKQLNEGINENTTAQA